MSFAHSAVPQTATSEAENIGNLQERVLKSYDFLSTSFELLRIRILGVTFTGRNFVLCCTKMVRNWEEF